MNEDQWLAAQEPDSLLKWLEKSKKRYASPRKCRLFSCACCRLIWQSLSPESRQGVELAEALADDQVEESVVEEFGESGLNLDCKGYGAVIWALWPPSGGFTGVTRPETAARSAAGYARDIRLKNHEAQQADLFREIVGNPYRKVTVDPKWLSWRNGTVRKLAETIYADRAFDQLPILADALDDAGCASEELLAHCRGKVPHVRGCWVVDLLIGKE